MDMSNPKEKSSSEMVRVLTGLDLHYSHGAFKIHLRPDNFLSLSRVIQVGALV